MNQTLVQRLTARGSPFELEETDEGLHRFVRPPHTLTDIYRRAERAGDRALLVVGTAVSTYGDIMGVARAQLPTLQSQGLCGKRVGLLLDDGAEWITWFVAITAAGAVCVMPPPGAARQTVAACLELARCAAIVDEGGLRLLGAAAPPAAPNERRASDWLELQPEAEAVVAFTSGSSGTPKGVVHSHRSLLSGLRNMMLGGAIAGQMIPGGARPAQPAKPPLPATLVLAPLAYIAGFSTLLLTLTSGGKIILASSAVATDALAAIVADQGVQSITGSSNELIRRLIDLPGALKLLAPLRRIHLHGEGLQYDLVSRIAAALPHAQVVTGYGLTETAGTIATAPAMRVLGRPGVCGLVLPTAKVRIVDGDGRPTPFGKVGEVEVRGEMLMRRYLGEEPNSSAFSPDGWFRPGDIGSIDAEGWLRILGRSSTTPSDETGVSLIAAEEALRLLDGIHDAVVALAPGGQVVAFVEPKPGQTPDTVQLSAGSRLHDLCGGIVEFRMMERLPRTGSGKVERAALISALSAAPLGE